MAAMDVDKALDDVGLQSHSLKKRARARIFPFLPSSPFFPLPEYEVIWYGMLWCTGL